MQPLAYQIGKSTCWATSFINGIMFLRKGERIDSRRYKIMQSKLNSLLRKEGVRYDTVDGFRDYESVRNRLEKLFVLRIRTKRGAEVARAIRQLHFKKQVAICDVGNGDHSILLNGKSKRGKWLYAFDPWWHGEDRKSNGNVRIPKYKTCVNVKIKMRHLLEDPYSRYEKQYETGSAYPMGAGKGKANHFLTVIESTT